MPHSLQYRNRITIPVPSRAVPSIPPTLCAIYSQWLTSAMINALSLSVMQDVMSSLSLSSNVSTLISMLFFLLNRYPLFCAFNFCVHCGSISICFDSVVCMDRSTERRAYCQIDECRHQSITMPAQEIHGGYRWDRSQEGGTF